MDDGTDHRFLIENYLRGVAIELVCEIDNVQSPWALPGLNAMDEQLVNGRPTAEYRPTLISYETTRFRDTPFTSHIWEKRIE